MKNIKKILILFPLLCLVWGAHIEAQDRTSYAVDAAQLLELVNLKTVDGREMAEVTLKLVLQLAIDRSTLIQASKLGNEAAQRTVAAAQESNTPSVTTSFGYSKTPSLSTSVMDTFCQAAAPLWL